MNPIETYEQNYEKINTVCLVWNNKKDNRANHGFGDKIRGLIYVHRYFKSKNNNINITVDATNDICGDILKNVKSKFANVINDVKINYITKEEDMQNLDVYNNDTIFIYSNNRISDNTLSDEEKNIAKFISEPNDTIKMEIDTKILKLPKEFTVKHFRFNDSVFKNDVDINDPTFKTFFDYLKKDYLETDILITNSKNFTKYAIEKLNIKYIDCDNTICDVGHMGQSTDYNTVKNSYIEYNIISRSKKIMSYTCYPDVSNFVLWPSKIYDIPFESIQLNTSQY